MQFNEKLKKLRSQKGVSQTQLANAIFVSRSAVAKWENGLGLPGEQSLKALADYFGVQPSELLSDPQTEEVIVTKNSELSKQKIWIIVLSVCMCIVIVGCVIVAGVLLNRQPEASSVTPVITRELVFETEKDLPTSEFENYSDAEISSDKPFAESRTFEIPKDQSAVVLPKILVKVTANGVVSYEDVIYDNLIVTCSTEYINYIIEHEADGAPQLSLTVNDFYEVEFQGWANIKYGDLSISVKIFRNPIAVENIIVSLDGGATSIGITERKAILTEVIPYDASYDDTVLSIENIKKADGTLYEGDLSEYAYISNGYLYTTEKIDEGATIDIIATTVSGVIKSNVLSVTVERIAVEDFSLRTADLSQALIIGESINLNLIVWPSNCTFNVRGENATVELLTPDIAMLKQAGSSWVLTAAADNAAIGKTIEISLTIEGREKIFEWEIYVIQPESVTILNAQTGAELEEITYLSRGDTLQLQANVFPENAIYTTVSYSCFANEPNFGRYVNISGDGLVTISDNAPFGLEIFISAWAGSVASDSYRIIIE